MQWTDEGIIIGTRRHGETSLIVELMTPAHGRHLGLVRGGRSRRQQPILQPGNSVTATWRARLDEHLGTYTVEATTQRAARLIEGAAGLYGIQALAGLLRLLPERDPHPRLYEGLAPFSTGSRTRRSRVRSSCVSSCGSSTISASASTWSAARPPAATTISPMYRRSRGGRSAVRPAIRTVTACWRCRPFCWRRPRPNRWRPADLAAGFRLTGYFLARHVFEPRGLEPPEARARFIALIARTGEKLESQGFAG